MSDRFQLTGRAGKWINGIRQHYRAEPLAGPAVVPPEHHFKYL